MSSFWCEFAVLPDGLASGVLVEVADGRFTEVSVGREPGSATRLTGVVLPGLANCHSHAFHRALRGRTHDGGGTFWTWRDRMYHVAAQLDPDNYLALARATYAEMALAGVTSVGEFHYVHHNPDGTPYEDPNAMAEALRQAAAEAGIRLTLLDTCYLAGGLTAAGHQPLAAEQRRFGDADAMSWAERVAQLAQSDGFVVGTAMHSVRAVPFEQLQVAASVASHVGDGGNQLHAHVSEQPGENHACIAHYGRTPVRLLHDAGLLDSNFTAVHATHLTQEDIGLLAAARATACFCPTTERDLADGVGPARTLLDAGVGLSLGSDQHAVIDLLEEARSLEMDDRLASLQRGRFTPKQLLEAATAHASIQWSDAGRIATGMRADLVSINLESTRTAGSDPAQIMLSANASDVQTVIVEGQVVVADGQHVLGDVGRLLSEAIAPFWEDR